jgi:hypothetical protein
VLGFPKTTLTPEGVPITASRQWRFGFYFNDDWKVSGRLTLNLGVPYDLFDLPHDANAVSRELRWDLGPQPVLWPAPGQQADMWINEHNHIAPRIGFAYRLGDKTAIRGGYGIFTAANHCDNLNLLQLNPPTAGSATIQNPIPAALYPAQPFFKILTVGPDRHHLNGYLQNANLQVSRELTRNDVIETGWVMAKGTHLDTSVNNYNSPDPATGDIQSRRPHLQFNLRAFA